MYLREANKDYTKNEKRTSVSTYMSLGQLLRDKQNVLRIVCTVFLKIYSNSYFQV